jgi:hypothetical protein
LQKFTDIIDYTQAKRVTQFLIPVRIAPMLSKRACRSEGRVNDDSPLLELDGPAGVVEELFPGAVSVVDEGFVAGRQSDT